jgi:hypothetical protein
MGVVYKAWDGMEEEKREAVLRESKLILVD